jgi:hypothetical protein
LILVVSLLLANLSLHSQQTTYSVFAWLVVPQQRDRSHLVVVAPHITRRGE